MIRVDVSEAGGVVVLVVDGEIDIANAPLMRAALEGLDPTEVVLMDLADVRFMDSSGLDVLVDQSTRMRQAGGHLKIRNPSVAVRRVVEITGFQQLLFASDGR
ncbi:MAG: STAS domain-containing protein [Ilumatobacteraceae bacterium]